MRAQVCCADMCVHYHVPHWHERGCPGSLTSGYRPIEFYQALKMSACVRRNICSFSCFVTLTRSLCWFFRRREGGAGDSGVRVRWPRRECRCAVLRAPPLAMRNAMQGSFLLRAKPMRLRISVAAIQCASHAAWRNDGGEKNPHTTLMCIVNPFAALVRSRK